MNGLGKDYIWSELFQHFNAAFLRKVEEIAHAITDLYCTSTTSYDIHKVDRSLILVISHKNANEAVKYVNPLYCHDIKFLAFSVVLHMYDSGRNEY